MSCFEWNLHTQISFEDSILMTTFYGITQWTLRFHSMTHYDFTIGHDVARDVYCDIIMDHDVVMGTYHDVTVRPSLIMYYMSNYDIYVLLVKSL